MKKNIVLLVLVLLVLSGCGNAETVDGAVSGESVAAGTTQGSEVVEDSEEAKEESEPEKEEAEGNSQSAEGKDAAECSVAPATEESKEPEGGGAVHTGTPKPAETPAESTPVETQNSAETTPQAPESTLSSVQTQAPTATPNTTQQQTHTCSWDGGTVAQAATCTAEGKVTYICTSCGKTKTESIAKAEHSYAWLYQLHEDLGNCTERYRLVDICANCGYILNTYTDEIMDNHELSEDVEEGGPICTSVVTVFQRCVKCGGIFNKQIFEPTGHQIGIGGNCNACGQHIEHQWVEGECYCGAVKEGYTEESVQDMESGEKAEN